MFSANSNTMSNYPASMNTGIKNSHWLEHFMHLNELNTILSSGGLFPHAIPSQL